MSPSPATAKASFTAFDDNWDSIEDLVKERSMEAWVAIESGMIDVEKALTPAAPPSPLDPMVRRTGTT
jgi:hypothetical protein